MEHWYTLYTKPNAEYQVAGALQQQAIEIFLPEFSLPNQTSNRIKRPVFPCYLFMKVNMTTVGLTFVRQTPGLRRVISFGDHPVPIDDKVIDLIRDKLDHLKAVNEQPVHTFEPGDPVRITAGPFRDMLAIFDGPSTPAERVQVLLNILGQASRMQIDATDLEKATADALPPDIKRARRTRGRGRYVNN